MTDPLAIAESVAHAVVAQPDLFAGDAFSADEQSTLRVARYGDYTGKLTTRDQVRVATVVALRQQGASMREIERRTGMDHRLIHRVLEYAEKAGHVPALKDVLARRTGEITELAGERLSEELRKPQPCDKRVKAYGVAWGIGLDKERAASVTVAGDLHVHQSVHLEGADPMRAWLQERASRLSTDSHAAGTPPNSHGSNATPQPTAAKAAAAQPPAIDVEASAAPDHPDQAEAGDAGPGGGGGGRGARGSGDR